jgi:hypothetical protein
VRRCRNSAGPPSLMRMASAVSSITGSASGNSARAARKSPLC